MKRVIPLILFVCIFQATAEKPAIGEEERKKREPAALDAEAHQKAKPGEKSALVGQWANYGGLLPSSVGYVHLLTIKKDGSYRFAYINFSVTGRKNEKGEVEVPPGAELARVVTGKIDLTNGKIIIPKNAYRGGVQSMTCWLENGVLIRETIGVTDERIHFSRIRELNGN